MLQGIWDGPGGPGEAGDGVDGSFEMAQTG